MRFDGDPGRVQTEGLHGKMIYIHNDGVRNAVYRIERAVAGEGGETVLLIGDVTLVRAYADTENYDAGFVYDLQEGAEFYIPLSAEWSRTGS